MQAITQQGHAAEGRECEPVDYGRELIVCSVGLSVMTLKAWLDGDSGNLQHLVALFSTGEVRVVQEGEAFFLTSSELDACSEPAALEAIALRDLDHLNGIGRVMDSGFRPVALSGRYEDGRNATAFAVAADEIRIRESAWVLVHGADGEERVPPAPMAPRYLEQATDPDVSEALGILGRSKDLSFVEMYKVYEIIQAQVGKLADQGWGISKRQEDSFTASACDPRISGDKARHARRSGSVLKPSRWMTEPDARRFIIDAVSCWLNSLETGSRPVDQSQTFST